MIQSDMIDIFDKFDNKGPIGQHAHFAHGYYTFPKLEGPIGPHMIFRGKQILNWSLNNYLGLASHPEVLKTDAEAATEYGLAYPMGARMMSGNSDYLEELERQLSEFMGQEDSIVLNYGYQGIMSIIDAILGRNDVVVYDSECHACIIDGMRMNPSKRYVFPHNNMEKFEICLKRATKQAEKNRGGILVITEGVFGMLGDTGKIKEIAAFKEKYNFRLLVDDAHGFGTMGPNGRGTHEHQEVMEQVDIYFSTFAKSMASIGGFVSSTKKVTDFLRYNLRSQIFAKALPIAFTIGNIKRLELLRTQPELRTKLWNIVDQLQSGLRSHGFDLGNTNSPVTPVLLNSGNTKLTELELINQITNLILDLREHFNIFCSAVVYPVVPKGIVMLRLISTAVHTSDDVNRTIEAFQIIYNKLISGEYNKDISSIMQDGLMKK